MKTIILLGIGMVLVLGLLMHVLTENITNELNKPIVYLGKKVVLDKDTLKVIDFSVVRNTFILSNNQEINMSLIDSIVLK